MKRVYLNWRTEKLITYDDKEYRECEKCHALKRLEFFKNPKKCMLDDNCDVCRENKDVAKRVHKEYINWYLENFPLVREARYIQIWLDAPTVSSTIAMLKKLDPKAHIIHSSEDSDDGISFFQAVDCSCLDSDNLVEINECDLKVYVLGDYQQYL